MKAFFFRIWYSLATRLIFLFLGLGICVIVLFTIIFSLFMQIKKPPETFPVVFLTYLSEKIVTQSDGLQQFDSAQEIMEDTIYSLRIDSPNTTWSTDDTIPRFTELSHYETLSESAFYYEANGGIRYLVLTRGEYSYIFGYRFRIGREDKSDFMAMTIPITAILILLISYIAVFKLFSPIRWVRRGAKRIGEGDLSYRIPYTRKDELGQLVDVINQMAEDLEQIFDSKRQLLLAISHELRSPLTRMKLNTALLDGSPVSQRLSGDINEMRDIVEGLLDSERLQGQHTALDTKPVQLEQLIGSIVAEYTDEGGVYFDDVQDAVGNGTDMMLDTSRIRFLLRNLINNALRYTDKSNRRIALDLVTDGTQVRLTVTDNGKGIAAKHLPHVLSPFYRADESRGRQTGGVGLGLHLCDLIVKAHGGKLSVDSTEGKGCCFLIVLPLNP